MARGTTPAYTVEFALKTNKRDMDLIDANLNVGIQIYNSCLGHALKRLKAVLADKNYRLAVKAKQEINAVLAKIPSKPSKYTAEQKELYKILKPERDELVRYISWLEQFYGYSEFDMFKFISSVQGHFKKNIGSLEAQEIATRAFNAVETLHYHQADKVHFKHRGDDMSIANKNNKSGLRYLDGKIFWGKLSLDFKVKRLDIFAQEGLMRDKLKYVRMIRREIRRNRRYFVQFVFEGFPPAKKRLDRETGELVPRRHVDTTDNRVGLDLGTSTVAIVSDFNVKLYELAENCKADEQKLRRFERAMDRSKRATNPDNFKENSVAKNGVKWTFSNHYLKLKSKRKDMHRKIAAKRKQAHETLANEILAQGSDVRVEAMRFQSLAKRAKKTTRNKKNGKINKKKRFGKSVTNHAPAMLITIIDRKLKYQGKSVKKIDTYATKASQFNHVTGEYTKKQLSDRWNNIQGNQVQRDIYSAFLIGNTNDSLAFVDVNLCNARWDNFLELHNREIARLQQSSNKALTWFVKPTKKIAVVS